MPQCHGRRTVSPSGSYVTEIGRRVGVYWPSDGIADKVAESKSESSNRSACTRFIQAGEVAKFRSRQAGRRPQLRPGARSSTVGCGAVMFPPQTQQLLAMPPLRLPAAAPRGHDAAADRPRAVPPGRFLHHRESYCPAVDDRGHRFHCMNAPYVKSPRGCSARRFSAVIFPHGVPAASICRVLRLTVSISSLVRRAVAGVVAVR